MRGVVRTDVVDAVVDADLIPHIPRRLAPPPVLAAMRRAVGQVHVTHQLATRAPHHALTERALALDAAERTLLAAHTCTHT